IISLNSQLEARIKVAPSRIKFVDFFTNNQGTNQQNNKSEKESFVGKMDISSNSDCDSDSS
ncbi:40749_t:CDS:1, partial [Gigaspora margarita]